MAKTKAQLLEENRELQKTLTEYGSILIDERQAYVQTVSKMADMEIEHTAMLKRANKRTDNAREELLRLEQECLSYETKVGNLTDELISLYKQLEQFKTSKINNISFPKELEVPHVLH